MNRDEKVAIVSELSETLTRAKLAVVADYCGLKVSEFQKIRVDLKECDSEVRVAKNSLLKRAVTDTDLSDLSGYFVGTTAVVTAYSDPVAPAKAITRFAEENDKFVIRAAALDGEKISVDNLFALSKLPTKEVLLGQLLSTWSNVPTGLVQVLSAVPRNFVYALRAIQEQKDVSAN